MNDKKYEVRDIGQLNPSDFADSMGVYDHIKDDAEDSSPVEDDENSQEIEEDESDVAEDTEDEDDDDLEEDDGSDDEDEDEELEEDGDDDEEEEDEDDAEEVVEKTKKDLVAVTKSGKKIVVPKDATVKHKVDGQVVELKVQDLLNDYAGTQTISRRMNEVAQKTKEAEIVKAKAESIQQEYQSFFNEISELTKAGKFDVAVEAIAYANNEDPTVFMKKLIDSANNWASTWGSMSDVEKARWEQEQQSRYFAKKTKAEQDKLERVQLEQQANKYISSVVSGLGIAEEQFFGKVSELAKNEKFSQLDIKGRVDYTVGMILGEKHVSNIEAVSRSFGTRVTPKIKALVAQHTTYQDSQDDIRKIISALLKDEKGKVAKTLSKKVRKGGNTPRAAVQKDKEGSRADQKQEKKVFGSFQDLMDSSY